MPRKDSGSMRKEKNNNKPTGQRRTTNCASDLDKSPLSRSKLKIQLRPSSLGLVPPFLGPVARQFLGWVAHGGRPALLNLSSGFYPTSLQTPLSRRFIASTSLVLQQSRTLRCGVQAGSLAGPSVACRPSGASHLVSMSLTRLLTRPR